MSGILKVKLVCVGKLKEKYLQQGVMEYKKRLGKYIKLEIEEVKDEPLPKKLNEQEVNKIIEKEEKKVREKLDFDAVKIVLDLNGRQFSSHEFARKVKKFENRGDSSLNFLIGGTMGFSKEFVHDSDLQISFSKMTFPHQLIRLMFLEQLYRAFKINKGEPYHR